MDSVDHCKRVVYKSALWIASHFRNFEKLTLFLPNLPISHPALHPLQLVTLPSAVSLDPNSVEPPFEIGLWGVKRKGNLFNRVKASAG